MLRVLRVCDRAGREGEGGDDSPESRIKAVKVGFNRETTRSPAPVASPRDSQTRLNREPVRSTIAYIPPCDEKNKIDSVSGDTKKKEENMTRKSGWLARGRKSRYPGTRFDTRGVDNDCLLLSLGDIHLDRGLRVELTPDEEQLQCFLIATRIAEEIPVVSAKPEVPSTCTLQ